MGKEQSRIAASVGDVPTVDTTKKCRPVKHVTWRNASPEKRTAEHVTAKGHGPLTSKGHDPLTTKGHDPLTTKGHDPLTSKDQGSWTSPKGSAVGKQPPVMSPVVAAPRQPSAVCDVEEAVTQRPPPAVVCIFADDRAGGNVPRAVYVQAPDDEGCATGDNLPPPGSLCEDNRLLSVPHPLRLLPLPPNTLPLSPSFIPHNTHLIPHNTHPLPHNTQPLYSLPSAHHHHHRRKPQPLPHARYLAIPGHDPDRQMDSSDRPMSVTSSLSAESGVCSLSCTDDDQTTARLSDTCVWPGDSCSSVCARDWSGGADEDGERGLCSDRNLTDRESASDDYGRATQGRMAGSASRSHHHGFSDPGFSEVSVSEEAPGIDREDSVSSDLGFLAEEQSDFPADPPSSDRRVSLSENQGHDSTDLFSAQKQRTASSEEFSDAQEGAPVSSASLLAADYDTHVPPEDLAMVSREQRVVSEDERLSHTGTDESANDLSAAEYDTDNGAADDDTAFNNTSTWDKKRYSRTPEDGGRRRSTRVQVLSARLSGHSVYANDVDYDASAEDSSTGGTDHEDVTDDDDDDEDNDNNGDIMSRRSGKFFVGSEDITFTSNTVTFNTVTSNTVTVNTDTANTVTANTVTPNTVTPNTVTANTVTPNTVTANTVTPNTVTSNTVTSNTVTSNTVRANTVTPSTVTSNTVTLSTVTSNTVTLSTLTANTDWPGIQTGEDPTHSGKEYRVEGKVMNLAAKKWPLLVQTQAVIHNSPHSPHSDAPNHDSHLARMEDRDGDSHQNGLCAFTKHPHIDVIRKDAIPAGTQFLHTDIISEDALCKDAIRKDAICKDAIRKDAICKDAICKDALCKDAIHKGAIRKNAIHKDALCKNVIRKDAYCKDTTRKDAISATRQSQGTDAVKQDGLPLRTHLQHEDSIHAQTQLQHSVVIHRDAISTKTPLDAIHQDAISTETPLDAIHQDAISTKTPLDALDRDIIPAKTHPQHIDAIHQNGLPAKTHLQHVDASLQALPQDVAEAAARRHTACVTCVTCVTPQGARGQHVRHVCRVCGGWYERGDHLQAHLAQHPLRRQHHCLRCGGCGAEFTFTAGLSHHLLLNRSDHGFCCPHCHQRFRHCEDLFRHRQVRQHHTDRLASILAPTGFVRHHPHHWLSRY